MKSIWLIAAILPSLLIPTLSGCSGVTPPQPIELTIIHSSDTNGYIDPCG
ncbi:MAG: hypothetical protein M1136_10975 [Chloroflexi bacterium]|nr:hypothetical protein [Chloroflexota bacterium]MCL5076148.1 hypothetical protein [Chloroflexota bacterium]